MRKDKGSAAATKELAQAVFGSEDVPADVISKVSGLPLDFARKALVNSRLYRQYLATKAAGLREAEVEFIFESQLDRAPTSSEIQKYSEDNLFLDEIREDIIKNRGK